MDYYKSKKSGCFQATPNYHTTLYASRSVQGLRQAAALMFVSKQQHNRCWLAERLVLRNRAVLANGPSHSELTYAPTVKNRKFNRESGSAHSQIGNIAYQSRVPLEASGLAYKISLSYNNRKRNEGWTTDLWRCSFFRANGFLISIHI